MSALTDLLDAFRTAAVTEREKGTYFEELSVCYLRNEPKYVDLYDAVWTYSDWAKTQGVSGKDVGIDLVARTRAAGEFHAIQCKLYDADHVIPKAGIDSFLAASGTSKFAQRIVIASTDHWTDNAKAMLGDQHISVVLIDMTELEGSVVDWIKYRPKAKTTALKAKKAPREHQQMAIREVVKGFETKERGRMIMACGTGKTFTSLKIAERQAGAGKRVLFLVPSLSLLSQSLTEWTQESDISLHSFAVCSDSDVGKRTNDDDEIKVALHELGYPATTDAKRLMQQVALTADDEHMSVVFSTYHSIDVVSRAQHDYGLPAFDLIVCDEAHRTTGHTFADDKDSNFVRVHNANYIKGVRRLYMTATPRIYDPIAKARAENDCIQTYSMDDESTFGPVLYLITFSEAVRRELLVDYKVIVLAVEESAINRRLQGLLSDENNSLQVDDAARIVGCWKGLAKQGLAEDWEQDSEPMKRAVAFCQVISPNYKGKRHKVSSIKISDMFQEVVEAYQAAENVDKAARLLCEAEHVDGGMNASEKEAKLKWLKANTPEGTCRVLSNVRCLSEGVDVPALDAVLFLTPRNSQVDVVQSVGRVMRKAPGKQRGYVILPVVIPAGVDPAQALDDNVTYRVVWQVLQALRSHDDRFDAMVNRMDLVGPDRSKMEVVAVTDKVDRKSKVMAKTVGKGTQKLSRPATESFSIDGAQATIRFDIGEIEKAIYAKIVKKVGNRHHWEDWASDIAKIANTHIDRINALLENPACMKEREAFQELASELRADLNDSISDQDIVDMLAQHLITKPVFEALFEGHNFVRDNPMSQAMEEVLGVLEKQNFSKETETLEGFYESVRERARGINTAAGKQRIITELYDKFFRTAFKRLTERLGIVYTPVEVVDFIIHSVNDVLQTEFGQTLGNDGVHILDPFVGTGTFITRLLQSGLIAPEQLPKKYGREIHANEIVLLAYYIAAINIEAAYHELVGGAYTPFEGICLTDTFRLDEDHDLVGKALVKNNSRVRRQKKLDIRVIIGNPPYSVGQESGNDNNQNVRYPALDSAIEATYALRSSATNKRALYDSYIRAIRWASTRVGDYGIIGFVTNAGFLDANTADGLRQCLAEEFSSIYVFHLRGNQRTSGENSRKEGGKIFDAGSRAPIAISILVKNPAARTRGHIRFYDIGDYLDRDEKLKRLQELVSIKGLDEAGLWQSITPNEHGDWLRQRDNDFGEFIAIGIKKGLPGLKLFRSHSAGLKSNRDAYCFDSSSAKLLLRTRDSFAFFNSEIERLSKLDKVPKEQDVNTLSPRFKWCQQTLADVLRARKLQVEENCIRLALYRPFLKKWVYFDNRVNWSRYLMPRFFPDDKSENLVICFKGPGGLNDFMPLMAKSIPDLCFADGRASQCFPLFIYEDAEPIEAGNKELFPTTSSRGPRRRDAITDEGLKHFLDFYTGESISKEDIFYYVYGILHSQDYRERYADTLHKELPRIPRVTTFSAFDAFVRAGRKLGEMHVNFETQPIYEHVTFNTGNRRLGPEDYRVNRMRYGKGRDKTILHYNDCLTVTGIPLEAYEYVVNGKAALDWVVERQCVSTDGASGIVSDANDWAVETMENSRYPLELFLRVITISLETMKIVRSLPPLETSTTEDDVAGAKMEDIAV